ncbi:TetR/AcrR family transcriptional regulator [Pedobacter fastidiosus]|uniref:TetR/AcrR family transcriptional regulator n=1 Tax=Pedobacter fastidiosus TaxID=2765361 RepID=A0ABR7KXL0_9SPHI|nr:TetR/AcrR family transcriptional regulator [Pedobacter fastidiosus]MBC6112806.1 TetR/AcrR family transcriptional regulator [Pedobacter fastidiosus]
MTKRRLNKIRDADATKRKFLDAIGTILTQQGFSAIRTNNIARLLGKDKNLIRYHFGSLNGLLKTYIQDKDYWKPFFERFRFSDNPDAKEIEALFVGLMQENFKVFSANEEMQKIIHWQISEASALMRSISDERELEGDKLLKMATPYFRESGVNFKAIIALLLGGSYFMVLQHKAINGVICGIDLNSEKDRGNVLVAIEKIIEWSWQYAENNVNDKLQSTEKMTYEFEQLEKLSESLLKDATDPTAFSELEKELKRLERVLLKQLLELSNETQISNFLQVNLYRMGEICDSHFDPNSEGNEVAQAILNLMDHLTSQVEPLLPDTMSLPKLFCKQQSLAYQDKWQFLKNWLQKIGIDEQLLLITGLPFEQFTHDGKMRWHNYKYLKKFEKVFEELGEELPQDNYQLMHLLIGLGFNHVRFENYCTKAFVAKIDGLAGAEAKSILKTERTRLFQVNLYTKMVFDQDRKPVDEALAKWIDATIKGLADRPKEIQLNPLKLKTRLTAMQLALFEKTLYAHGFYDEPNLDVFSEKIACNFSTKGQDVLSAPSVKSKMYTKDVSAIKPLEPMVAAVLEDLRSFMG